MRNRLLAEIAAAALRGIKYVVEKGLDIDSFKEPTVIFEGRPEEACRAFPTTSNVAASLRLAAGTATNVCIRVVAVPGGTENVHEIEAEGAAGRFAIQLQGRPSRSNPKTSALAAMSVARALLNERATIVI